MMASKLMMPACAMVCLLVTGCSSPPAAPSDVEAAPAAAAAVSTDARGGRAGTTGVVYVTSQGLYYNTFVARDPLTKAITTSCARCCLRDARRRKRQAAGSRQRLAAGGCGGWVEAVPQTRGILRV